MCGRTTYLYRWEEVYRLLNLTAALPAVDLVPSYNVAPAQQAPVCRIGAGGDREISMLTWGFVPSWGKDGAQPLINARSETAATSPVFRSAMARRRCIVPISGFYEWKPSPGSPGLPKAPAKQPMYIRLLNEELLCLAGVWERRPNWAGGVDSFAILTTEPNELLRSIHTRMPVILRREHIAAWLGPDAPGAEVFQPFPAEEMCAVAVSPRVNSPRNNDARLLDPAPEPPPASSTLWSP